MAAAAEYFLKTDSKKQPQIQVERIDPSIKASAKASMKASLSVNPEENSVKNDFVKTSIKNNDEM